MLRKILLASIVMAPVIANAQPIQGLYIDLGAGGNYATDMTSAAKTTKIDSSIGPIGAAAIGWGFGNGFSAEIEGSHRSDTISSISTLRNNGLTLPLANPQGRVATYAAMANIKYDIPVHPFGLPLQPYVGAGAGYAWLDLSDAKGNGFATLHLADSNTYIGPVAASFGTSGAFAYQAMLGTSYPVASLPGLAVTLEYRFFGTARADVPVTRTATNGDTFNGVTPSHLYHNGFFAADHSILIGLRYNFGHAPAPVTTCACIPAAPDSIARSYTVFFDWDKATLTDRARQIVTEAATASTKVQYTWIEVNGYTDTSGTPSYNQALSLRRANAVAAELVKDHIPMAAITIQGFGEIHQLVPTGNGVREPQNRRVEIVIN